MLRSLSTANRMAQRFIIGSCFETACDNEGRLEIPPHLLPKSTVGSEVLVVGLVNRFEIWDREVYENRSSRTNESFLPEELVEAYGKDAGRIMRQIRKSYSRADIGGRSASLGSRRDLFLCHASEDKDFVRRLARDLTLKGVTVWYDEWEMLPGDSLYQKIQTGIADASWFAIVLSENSVQSSWCKRELHNALDEEFSRDRIFVIPILYKKCDIPGFLKEKVYVDLSGDNYDKEFGYLLRRFDL